MDIRQLQTLVAVADHRTFSGAAKALFTVQSNVSAHIAKLERELGVTLVDRGRGTLTEQGRVVAARARRIQAELDALRGDLASLGAQVAGTSRLGVIPTTARWLLPRLLPLLAERHPRVRLVVTSSTTATLLPQLLAGALDAAITTMPVDDPELAVTPLFVEDLVLVAPVDHPLANRAEVTLADLARHALLLEAPGTPLREELDQAATRAGVQLRAAAEVDGVRLLASLAVDGHGAAVVPATTLSRSGPTAVIIPLRGVAPREVGVVRPRRGLLSAPANAVLATVTDALAGGPVVPGVRFLAAAAKPDP
jgi:LysR family hydrogen peroxide-inducible transcriptional activator